jgi:hypothetical protein
VKRISLVLIGLLVLSGMAGYAATSGLFASGHSGAESTAALQSGTVNAGTSAGIPAPAPGDTAAKAAAPGPPRLLEQSGTFPGTGSALPSDSTAQSSGGTSGTTEFPATSAIGPKIIKTADLSVQVKKGGFSNAFESATLVAQKYNGFVVSSSTQGSASRSGNLLIRVPMQSFDLAVHDLSALGTVDKQSENGQDVTSQYVDLNARLRTWQSQENVLLRLMNQAHSINDTMQVQRELQQVQFQIEDIKGQLRVLNDQTALGTIQLDLHEPGVSVAPSPKTEPKPSLADAWDQAVAGFLGVISLVIVGLGYVIPLAAIGGCVWLVYRRVKARDAGAGSEAAA